LFVVVVAVSALVSGNGSRRDIIDVRVFDERSEHVLTHYDPLRTLLSGSTRRPVTLHADAGWDGHADLYIVSTYEYLARPDDVDVEAIYEIARAQRLRDSAILITGKHEVVFSEITPDDVVFAGPYSVNGYWQQLPMLADRGFYMPESGDAFHFAGNDGDHTRVVLGVALGEYKVGACRLSDLSGLVAKGAVDENEITVVERVDALPEVLIAVAPDEAKYYGRKLEAIAGLLDANGLPPGGAETLRLMETRWIRAIGPVATSEMSLAGDLFARALQHR